MSSFRICWTRPSELVRIILSGSMGRLPIGGYAWMDLQWLAGLRSLGADVYYLEDCGEGSWVYNWDTEEVTTDLDYPSSHVRSCLEPIGLSGRWIYRAGEQTAGMSAEDFACVCTQADLLICHGVPLAQWRPEYLLPRRRMFLDVDPGFVQIGLAQGDGLLSETVDHCHTLFTIGQRIGTEGCVVPTGGREWKKTVPPISLDQWPVADEREPTHFTCVMQWRGHKEVVHEGVLYGQKDKEFPKFMELPRHTAQPFLIALTGADPGELSAHGWQVEPGWVVSRTPWTYQSFIHRSRAEFSVAKHGYVAMQAGWFSDRSLCYLASGRPVLVEDTGLRPWLPIGEGVVTFTDLLSALEGIERINADYDGHCRSARRIAEEYFAADQVLPRVLEVATA